MAELSEPREREWINDKVYYIRSVALRKTTKIVKIRISNNERN